MATHDAAEAQVLVESLERMLSIEGFDVVVVCTGTRHQAEFWQNRLDAARGLVIPATCVVLCVHEDWAGGAGNGLGTLYAWRKACALYEATAGAGKVAGGLGEALDRGDVSAALYHTAGKGTRLAPLPGAENNNKPGVKLPCSASAALGPLTILESVIKQTGVYASSRAGRLSVFWGDQIFVPTVEPRYDAARAHADILCLLAPMPDATEWAARGLEKYGLVAVSAAGSACQIEKVDHATAVAYTSVGLIGGIAAVGTSLGSFSMSAALLAALNAEFHPELDAKKGQLDSDPHWWMPMTLPVDAYVGLMANKDVSAEAASAHHGRIHAMLTAFVQATGTTAHILGPVDVGANAYWWDYGQLKLYNTNARRLAADGVEAGAMRTFLGVTRGGARTATLDADDRSCATACSLDRGRLDKAILAYVNCPDLEATDCVLVNVTARKIRAAPNSIAYNVVDDSDELVLRDGDVVTDIFQPDGSVLRQCSRMDQDGGKLWKVVVPPNNFSFEQVYNMNLGTDIIATSKLAAKAHANLKAKLGL